MNLNELRKCKLQIQVLAIKYKIDPEPLRVFGPVVHRDAKPKDIGLLFHPLQNCSLLDFGGFYEEIKQVLHAYIHIVPVTCKS